MSMSSLRVCKISTMHILVKFILPEAPEDGKNQLMSMNMDISSCIILRIIVLTLEFPALLSRTTTVIVTAIMVFWTDMAIAHGARKAIRVLTSWRGGLPGFPTLLSGKNRIVTESLSTTKVLKI